MKALIVLDKADNVGNAIEDIHTGDRVSYQLDGEQFELQATSDTPFGFKVAVRDIPANSPVIKYKETIGMTSRPIVAGECVHIHNVEGNRGRGDIKGEN